MNNIHTSHFGYNHFTGVRQECILFTCGGILFLCSSHSLSQLKIAHIITFSLPTSNIHHRECTEQCALVLCAECIKYEPEPFVLIVQWSAECAFLFFSLLKKIDAMQGKVRLFISFRSFVSYAWFNIT